MHTISTDEKETGGLLHQGRPSATTTDGQADADHQLHRDVTCHRRAFLLSADERAGNQSHIHVAQKGLDIIKSIKRQNNFFF